MHESIGRVAADQRLSVHGVHEVLASLVHGERLQQERRQLGHIQLNPVLVHTNHFLDGGRVAETQQERLTVDLVHEVHVLPRPVEDATNKVAFDRVSRGLLVGRKAHGLVEGLLLLAVGRIVGVVECGRGVERVA